jgi:FdhD protein
MHSKDMDTITYQDGEWNQTGAEIIAERPVSLTVNNEVWLTFMCTPCDLEAMAIGFLYNEETISAVDEVASVRVCPAGDNIDVWLQHAVDKPKTWTKTSGCSGGSTSIEKTKIHTGKVMCGNGSLLAPEKVGDLIRQLNEAQILYRKTGGVHTSALSDGEGLVLVAEDIGRHNTLDKLAGRYLLEKIKLGKKIILTTGRISSEMVQKAGRMGASVVISRTSPSTLSVKMAEQLGITLIGYAKSRRFTVYAHPERILSIPTGETIKREVT